MLDLFKAHLVDNFPYLENKQLLMAISGGLDSVVLTRLLHQLGYNITLVHCNFKLRQQESDLDEQFVTNLADDLRLGLHTIQFDTVTYAKNHNQSIQLAARELRYNWFRKLLNTNQFDFVITAHHADDNLETLLINLTRGTGLDGLTGIPERNQNIIRPFLKFSRETILHYANSKNWVWREDQSNSNTKYLRNKIRHEVVPILKTINPNITEQVYKTTMFLKDTQHLVDDHVAHLNTQIQSESDSVKKFNIKKILSLPHPKAYLYQVFKKYPFKEWDNIFDLLTSQTGKYLSTKRHILLKNRDFLLLSPAHKEIASKKDVFYIDKKEKLLEFPLKLKIEITKNIKVDDKNSILVDKNLVFYPLILRRWKKGDLIYPSGMNGKKKVSKYFKDEKMSLFEKQNTWLLCSKTNDIVWIVGKRQDRRFMINNNTSTILKLSI